MVIPQPGVRPDVQAAEHRGARSAARQAYCPELVSRSAQVLLSVQARLVALSARRAQGLRASLSAQVWAALRDLLREAVLAASEPGVRRMLAASVSASARVAAAPLREAVPVAWEPGEPQAVPQGPVSGRAAAGPLRAVPVAWEPGGPQAVPTGPVSEHAAAGPQPAAAKAALARQAAVGPDGPRVAAEVALQDAAVQLQAEVQRADGAVRLRAAVRPGARGLQAARPRGPSAAASVFRQGPSLVAGPARPRAAAHFALAMQSLRTASRSEPWSRAARNEDWSWW